jgi:cytoskeletal protein RodZ
MKHLTEEQIAQYAEALSEETSQHIDASLREHVKECDLCADEVATVSAMLDEGIASGSSDTRVRSIHRKVSFWVSVAAGLVLLVSVGVYFLYFQSNHQPSTPLVAENQKEKAEDHQEQNNKDIKEENATDQFEESLTDSSEGDSEQLEDQIAKTDQQVTTKQDNNQLAEAYRPSSRLEQLSSRYDGVSMRSDGFEMRSKHILSTEKNDTLNISWIADQSQKLLFSLYDNKEQLVAENEVPVKGYSFVADYEKGLYYYKVVNQDFDLLYCGKIIIE